MLRKWMNTHHNVRAPALEEFIHVANASLMEEFSCFWSEPVNKPVKIFHPMLPVSQQPIVEPNHLRSNCVRLLHCPHNTHRIRLTLKKSLYSRDDRCRRRAVSAACVR